MASARGQSLTAESGFDSRLPFGGSLGRTDWSDGRGMGTDRPASSCGTRPRLPPCSRQSTLFRRHDVDGAHRSAMAAAARRIRQMEQRLSPISAMGRDRCVRGYARNAGRVGRAGPKRRHDRQHRYPGTSLCSRHKKGTQETEALGRSRGGFTTKLHARCDAKGQRSAMMRIDSLSLGEARSLSGLYQWGWQHVEIGE